MRNLYQKKCDLFYGISQIELRLLVKCTHSGQSLDLNAKREKINNGSIFVFKKTFISKHFSIYKPELNKNVLGTDKIYYNGTVHLS